MNRLLAQIVLILMAIGLVYSMYAFAQGRFIEAIMIYPLLIAGYLFSRATGKNREDD